MRLIVSGQYFGEPLKDAVFLNVVLSWGLKSLYCLNSNIEWYGLYMFIAMYISCTIVHYIFVKNSSTFKSLLIKNVQYIIIFILLLYRQLLMVQFTMVAAMLCMAAIACLVEWAKLYTKNNKLHNWYFILFVFLIFYIYHFTLSQSSININLISTANPNSLYNNKLIPRFIWFLFSNS